MPRKKKVVEEPDDFQDIGDGENLDDDYISEEEESVEQDQPKSLKRLSTEKTLEEVEEGIYDYLKLLRKAILADRKYIKELWEKIKKMEDDFRLMIQSK